MYLLIGWQLPHLTNSSQWNTPALLPGTFQHFIWLIGMLVANGIVCCWLSHFRRRWQVLGYLPWQTKDSPDKVVTTYKDVGMGVRQCSLQADSRSFLKKCAANFRLQEKENRLLLLPKRKNFEAWKNHADNLLLCFFFVFRNVFVSRLFSLVLICMTHLFGSIIKISYNF